MKKLSIFAWFICLSGMAVSQPYVNVLQLGYSYQPNFPLEDSDDEVNFTELNLDLTLPLVLKNEDVILLNAGLRQVDLNSAQSDAFASPATALAPGEPMQSITFRLGYRKKWSDAWNSVAYLQVRRTGALSEGVSDALQFGGIFIVEKKHSPTLSMRYGAYLSGEFFGPLLVPLVGFDWVPSEKWYIFTNLPITGTAMYKASDKLHIGFSYTGLITSFRLSEAFDNSYLHHASTDAVFRAELSLTQNLVLQANVGRSIGRYYRQYPENEKLGMMVSAIRMVSDLRIGDDRPDPPVEVGDGWIGELRLIFRVMK